MYGKLPAWWNLEEISKQNIVRNLFGYIYIYRDGQNTEMTSISFDGVIFYNEYAETG